MKELFRYSRSVSNKTGRGLPLHRLDTPIGVREDTGLLVRSAGKQFYDPDDGFLVGAWLMDEDSGLFVRDHSINRFHGKTVGSPAWVPDGIDFEQASTQYIELDTNDLFYGNKNPEYTLLCWFNVEDLTNNPWLFHQGLATANDALGFLVTAAGKITHYWWGNDITGDDVVAIDTWNLVAATFDGTVRKIYVNGNFDKQDLPSGHNLNGSTGVWIGGRNAGAELIDGIIHSFFVYGRALSAEEIFSIHAAGRYRRTESYRVLGV